jgi:N-acetylglucosamine-6-phosphate deacetylase
MRYFDLQVNGYAGVDFNSDTLTTEQAELACSALEEDGTGGILATVITDSVDAMKAKIRRIVRAREEDETVRRVVVGIHIEGPFLNPADGFIGAHPRDQAQPACVDIMKDLMDAGEGLTRVVTLAPECDMGLATTRYLAGQGVVVSAGHCNPSMDQLQASIDAGLTMFTHLGNGCPQYLPRHENIVERVLSLSQSLWVCFIGDGIHVPGFALKNYLRAATLERCLVVTDAISAARCGPGAYTLGDREIKVGADEVARSPDGSHFMGSTATMPRVERVLRDLGVNEGDITGLCRDRPRRAIGC